MDRALPLVAVAPPWPSLAIYPALCSIRSRSSASRPTNCKALKRKISIYVRSFSRSSPSPGIPGTRGGLLSILPFVFIFVIMYYVMLRPQMQRQKEQAQLVSSLKTGDRVVTSSGIHGLISNVKDTTVIVKVADNVKIEMEKTSVTNVVKSTE